MPIEGSDFTINIEAEEDLTGATVTIEYRTPNTQIVEDVTPTNVNTETDVITYKIEGSKTIKGIWKFWAKVINSYGDVSFTDPPASINFKGKG